VTQRLINGPFPLRAVKVALALTLGTPATLIWMPYMVPFALFGPFMLVRDAVAGHVNITDLRGIGIAVAGTAGLAGFWLWVFDHPGRSVRMQRSIGLLWLAGGVVLGAHLLVLPDLSGALFAATVALTVAVVLMGLAMSIRPRAP
jgi:hypothetical protein